MTTLKISAPGLLALLLLALMACAPPDYADEGGEATGRRETPRPDAAPGRDALPPEPALEEGTPWCPEADGALMLPVRSAQVFGQVRFSHDRPGAPGWADAPVIGATDLNTGHTRLAEVSSDGRFELEVFDGTHDLWLGFGGQESARIGATPRIIIEAGRHLEGYSEREVRVETVTLGGLITLDGQDLPSNDRVGVERGEVLAVDRATGAIFRQALPGARPAIFELPLPVGGSYALYWATAQGGPLGLEAAGELPMGVAHLGDFEAFEREDWVQFDVSSLTITARLTIEGEPIDADTVLDGRDRGELLVRATEAPGTTFRVGLGEEGVAVLRARVFRERYSVELLAGARDAQDALPPSSYAIACAGCAWDEGGDVPMDFTYVYGGERTLPTVAGTAGLRDEQGRPVALDPACGRLVIYALATDQAPNFAASMVAEEGRFEAELPEGTYDLWLQLEGWGPSCPVGMAPAALGVEVGPRGVEVDLTGVLAPLRARILVDGQPMRDDGLLDGEPRGAVELRPVGFYGWPVARVELGEEGPAQVELMALAGHYEATLTSLTVEGRASLRPWSQDVLPRMTTGLGRIEVAPGAAELELGVRTTRLAAEVYLNDRVAMAMTRDVEGVVHLVDARWGHEVSIPLEGPVGRFDMPIYQGVYRVLYAGIPGWSESAWALLAEELPAWDLSCR